MAYASSPTIPNPQEGKLQQFAYDLRELGEGKVSVTWIAGHEETTVSKAALYAALSGTRLPKRETVSTLLRWWAGDPAHENPDLDDYYIEPTWSWIDRLPRDHEGGGSGSSGEPAISVWPGMSSANESSVLERHASPSPCRQSSSASSKS